MGCSEVAARSHARRLEREGWLARFPMTRGEGSLFVATWTGISVLGLRLRIELLDTIESQTIEACERTRADRVAAQTEDA
jgi:hypothetical protein